MRPLSAYTYSLMSALLPLLVTNAVAAADAPGVPEALRKLSPAERIKRVIEAGGYRPRHHPPGYFDWIRNEPHLYVDAIESYLRVPTTLEDWSDDIAISFLLVQFLDDESAVRICVEMFVGANDRIRSVLLKAGLQPSTSRAAVKKHSDELERYIAGLHLLNQAAVVELTRRRSAAVLEYSVLVYEQGEQWDLVYDMVDYYGKLGAVEGLLRMAERVPKTPATVASRARGYLAKLELTDVQRERLREKK